MGTKSDRILVVDNDKSICWVLEKALADEGYNVDVVMDGQAALDKIEENKYSLAVMDVMMPVMDGLTALERIRALPEPPEIIMITAYSSMESTVEAMKLGAFDYIIKPFDIDEVIDLVARALEKHKNRVKPGKPSKANLSHSNIIGDSQPMRELYKILGRIASTDSTVLITGETGTGKDLFARAIHYHSSRRDMAFININCASLPGELLESELFGHVRGAFTGATVDRMGKCEIADGGTLFLDEIGTMRVDLQAKLLRFLQLSEFERVGASKTIHVDVRVLTATNADLKKLTKQGLFREDLYYRLKVVPVTIPPLRDRKEDIKTLAKYFVDLYNAKYNLNYKLSAEHIGVIEAKDWPGNVRELENYIHQMVVLQSDTYEKKGFGTGKIPTNDDGRSIDSLVSSLIDSGIPDLLEVAREHIEKPLLAKLMLRLGDNQSEAAKILGVSRNTLRKMLDRYSGFHQDKIELED